MIDKEIDPTRFYTLYEIVREGLIPGATNIAKAARIVKTDSVTNRILKAQIVPRGEDGTQYKIRGSNIIKFLSERDDG